MWANKCPKCRGDLFLREDLYVNEAVCVQCDSVLSPEQARESAEQLRRDEAPRPPEPEEIAVMGRRAGPAD